MWRAAIASMVLGVACVDPITYDVTTSLTEGSSARLVFDGLLFLERTESYEVHSYDELRDVAASVTVRVNNRDFFVVLPFAASACGSEQWMHSGELTRIEVRYLIYPSGAGYVATTDHLACSDSDGDTHTAVE